jgi:hypothetical protein
MVLWHETKTRTFKSLRNSDVISTLTFVASEQTLFPPESATCSASTRRSCHGDGVKPASNCPATTPSNWWEYNLHKTNEYMMRTWWVHDEYMMWRVHTSSTSSLDVAWRASWTQPRFFSGGICFHIAKAALAWHRGRGPRFPQTPRLGLLMLLENDCKHNEDNEDTVTVLANCITPQISSYPVVARTRKTETP